jgi:hypothetical protein
LFTDSRFNTALIEIIFNFIKINGSIFKALGKTFLMDGKIKGPAIGILGSGFIKKIFYFYKKQKRYNNFLAK